MIYEHQVIAIPRVKLPFQQLLEKKIASMYTNSALKINELASALYMCERQLHRYIKVHFNMKPSEYLRKYRLTKASELLKQGFSAKKVTFDVGFSSYSYFARCFKQEFGCTSKQYSKQDIEVDCTQLAA
jgi:AraC-like DNA-binding protein